MADFPSLQLTAAGERLLAKVLAGAELMFSKVALGAGSLPPGLNPFSAVAAADQVTIYHTDVGACADAADVDSGFVLAVNQQGDPAIAEETGLTCLAASNLAGGESFQISTPSLDYYLWYRVDGAGVDPAPAGAIGIVVDVAALDTAVAVAAATATAIDQNRLALRDLVRLIDTKLDLAITAVEVVGDGSSRLRAALTNVGLAQSFEWREIGVFATDPDDGEILYSVTNALGAGDLFPAEGGSTVVEGNLNLITDIGSATNVTAIVVPSATFVTWADLADHLAKRHRPWKRVAFADSPYAAACGDHLQIDVSAGPVVINLPAGTVLGDEGIQTICYDGLYSKNNLTFTPSAGEKSRGIVDDPLVVTTDYAPASVIPSGAEKGWLSA